MTPVPCSKFATHKNWEKSERINVVISSALYDLKDMLIAQLQSMDPKCLFTDAVINLSGYNFKMIIMIELHYLHF